MAEARGGGMAPDGHNPEVVSHLRERHQPLTWGPTGLSLRQETSSFRPSAVFPLMSVVERTTAVQQPLYQNIFVENILNLRCKSLTKCGLASERETEKMRLSVRIVSVSVRFLYPARYRYG